MTQMNPEADALNKDIQETHPVIYNLLSEKGKQIYFPQRGIVQQGIDAKGTRINATIGMAVENDKSPMRLQFLSNQIPLDPKDVFPYAPTFGIRDLREKWQEMIRGKNPSLTSRTSLPVITNGITHGLSVIGYLFINPGDNIITPHLFWGNYRFVFERAYNGRLLTFRTFMNGVFNTAGFGKILKENNGKQVILLNFPNNPTGYTVTPDEAEKIQTHIKESAENGNEILVINDDAYFGLAYEKNILEESLFSKLADLHNNVLAVKIDGSTKEDYAWGFRIGFVTYASKGITEKVCSALESKTSGAIRGSISSASHLSQSYLFNAISSPNYLEDKIQKYNTLKARFDKVKEIIKQNERKYSPFFSPLPFNSGYFMCIRLREDLDTEAIRQMLLKDYSTGVIAIKRLLRVAFSSVAEEDIPNLFENIYNACVTYSNKDLV